MDTIDKLIEHFRRFPGIGPRQAKRFVYFLLAQTEGYRDQISHLITDLKKQIRVCTSCFRYFPVGTKASNECVICQDKNRRQDILLVVSRDVDFENIEKSHSFDGTYFILGGSVPILEETPESRVRSNELLSLVEKKAANGLKEVILAFNLTPEGENTHVYVSRILEPLTEKYGLKISTLGRGLSTGLELEYSDSETVKNALLGRR